MLQPKKNKSNWEEEQAWLQNWYANRVLPDPNLNQTYQKEKKLYTDKAKTLPSPKVKEKIDNENTQGYYHDDTGVIDLLSTAGPLVYTHEGSHAINNPLRSTNTSTNAFSAITENILPQDKISNEWIKNNYSQISNYNEIIPRLNSYRQLHNLKPDQEITPELIKQNRDLYNTGKIEFEDNTDQLYKLFEDEGLSNVLNKVVINDSQDDTAIAAFGTGQKGTTMKRKKYALGSTGIENPATTIARNNIMIAEAEQKAQNNPWIPITMLAGQLASTALSSGIASKTKAPTSSSGNFELTDPGIDTTNQNYMSPVQGQYINALGNNQAAGNIEVEGQEVVELPTGQVAEVKGASHEKGGVDLNVPEGTKIYSKRIEKFGETMAERKKARERKKLNLDKLLENSKTDIGIRNAHKRTMETLQAQEEEDLKTQELFGIMAAVQEYAFGTNKDGTPKYATGTGLPRPVPDYGYANITNNYDTYSPELPVLTEDNTQPLTMLDLAAANPPVPETKIDLPGSVFSRTVDTVGNTIDKSGIKVPGIGDLTAIGGDLISAFGPMKNTLANRAGDTPNINAFADFGKDALETNLAAMELGLAQKDSALKRITGQANASKRAGRNSARGVNQLRALDLATDINVNEASQSATDSFTRTMQELLGQRTGLENSQDSAVMQGEAQRDLADRQDRDNFSTQLGRDIATQGQGVQQIGKDLNTIKQNEMMTNVINQLSKYGLAFDAQGNLIQKPQTK